jgi:hypothetical protein
MDVPLIIKLEIESLKVGILRAVDPEVLGPQIQAAAEKAISEFDFEGAVAEAVGVTVKEAVKRYFYAGPGEKVICEAVVSVMNQTLERMRSHGSPRSPEAD